MFIYFTSDVLGFCTSLFFATALSSAGGYSDAHPDLTV